MPKYLPVPVKGLWEAASETERQKAHQTGVAILEMWLGQATKKETAARLDVPVLRVWQLSQQALSGLVAGLLKQPRSRGAIKNPIDQQAPWKLRKEIAKLQKEVDSLRSLVDLLRDFPIHREIDREKEVDRVQTSTKKVRHSRRDPKGNRKKPAARTTGKRGARSGGASTRSGRANGEKLDEERTRPSDAHGSSAARPGDTVSGGEGGGPPAESAG
jgi:hypothetical protein